MTDFVDVSELVGDLVSQEQVQRLCHRYAWAAGHCQGRDVLEAACGSGPGLGILARVAKSVQAGDYSTQILSRARAHYGDRIKLRRFDAEEMPFDDGAFDVVILFEALYFLPSAERFVAECRRVLRPGGRVLVATANKDLFDFNPCPHSRRYFGAVELHALFAAHGFEAECWGYLRTDRVAARQRLLRPIKKLAVGLNLMPRTMAGKTLLKRLVFGKLVPMPAEIMDGMDGMGDFDPPDPVATDRPDTIHKVIYCAATLC